MSKGKEKQAKIEEQILLRVPPAVADQIRQMINLKTRKRLTFAMIDDREARLQVDNQEYAGKLVDLPCHIESHRTYDKVTAYKSADIAQMLIFPEAGAVTPGAPTPKVVADIPAQYPSGLTPPTTNILPGRYRRKVPPEKEKVREVEKQLNAIHNGKPEYVFEVIYQEVEVEENDDGEWEEEEGKASDVKTTPGQSTPTGSSGIKKEPKSGPRLYPGLGSVGSLPGSSTRYSSPHQASPSRSPSPGYPTAPSPSQLATGSSRRPSSSSRLPSSSPHTYPSSSPTLSVPGGTTKTNWTSPSPVPPSSPDPSPLGVGGGAPPPSFSSVSSYLGLPSSSPPVGQSSPALQAFGQQGSPLTSTPATGRQSRPTSGTKQPSSEILDLNRQIAQLEASVAAQSNRLLKMREEEKLKKLKEERDKLQRLS